MKKLLIISLFIASAFCINQFANISTASVPKTVIINYEPSHEEAVIAMSYEDSLLFFIGSALVDKGQISKQEFEELNLPGMKELLADSAKVKRVIVDSEKVVGYSSFYKTLEPSIEATMKQLEEYLTAQGAAVTPEMEAAVIAQNPHMKRTIAECKPIVLIEAVVVSGEFRRKGHAKALLNDAIHYIQANWPEVEYVILNVNAANEGARKLYEMQGFKVSEKQAAFLKAIEAIQYEKAV